MELELIADIEGMGERMVEVFWGLFYAKFFLYNYKMTLREELREELFYIK